MKKLWVLLFFVASITNAQYSIEGEMQPMHKSDWVILYKIEGARQKFVQNTKIKTDTTTVNNKEVVVGKFSFTLPEDAKQGMYRATYRLKGEGYIDFLFNKEDISFTFNPNFPEQSIVYSSSKENKMYREFLEAIAIRQKQLDSIQMIALKNPEKTTKEAYKKVLDQVNDVHRIYENRSKGMMVNHFIRAIQRKNPENLISDSQKYFNYVLKNFFSNMDFNSKTLYNSSFLVDRISDYIFYLNYSNEIELQQKLYKESIANVISKIDNESFKKDVLEFLIAQFSAKKNVDIVDHIFDSYYDKLQTDLQNKKFKDKILSKLRAEVGRIAPDFSWKFDGKEYQLSKLKDARYYILVFWSTKCSHCLRDMPRLHEYLKGVKDVKVIGFAIEENDYAWNNYIYKLSDWYNVLGLNRWKNETSRKYNVHSTPSYFVLDTDKKIIAKPYNLEALEKMFSKE